MDKNRELQTGENVEEATINGDVPKETILCSNESEKVEENNVIEEQEEEKDKEQNVEVNIGDVVNNIAELNEKMEEMNRLFVQKIQHTAHEGKIVDQMHAELQKYKEDLYSQLIRPILLDIIEVRDSIIRITKNYSKEGYEEEVIPLKVFSDYTYDVQDILEKNNIIVYQGESGDVFNPIKHRVLKKVITEVEELHGKIAESLSSGYEYMGKTISPEKIVVYFYEKPVEAEGGIE